MNNGIKLNFPVMKLPGSPVRVKEIEETNKTEVVLLEEVTEAKTETEYPHPQPRIT